MGFRYSCFISYPHGQAELTRRFVEQLKNAVKSLVDANMDEDVFIDYERLKTGHLYNEDLARAICESVGMILVLSPKYFSAAHPYCIREYRGMVELERRRLALLGADPGTTGLIYPIVFRQPDEVPHEIREKRLFSDFSRYTLYTPDLSTLQEYVDKIQAIAEAIYGMYKRLRDLPNPCGGDCSVFRLPSEEEARSWLLQQRRPSPPHLPGRTGV